MFAEDIHIVFPGEPRAPPPILLLSLWCASRVDVCVLEDGNAAKGAKGLRFLRASRRRFCF